MREHSKSKLMAEGREAVCTRRVEPASFRPLRREHVIFTATLHRTGSPEFHQRLLRQERAMKCSIEYTKNEGDEGRSPSGSRPGSARPGQYDPPLRFHT